MEYHFASSNLLQLLYQREKNDASRIYLRQAKAGEFIELTWGDTMTRARKIAAFLKSRGFLPGDRIAIISKNCPEWFIADFGIALAGMVSVPIFANQHYETVTYVMQHAEVKLAFIGKLDDAPAIAAGIPAHVTTVDMGYPLSVAVQLHWNNILKSSAPDLSMPQPKPDDLFTLIYTSGTSGNPKGVMATHENVARVLHSYQQDIKKWKLSLPLHLISYLPLAHVFERVGIECGSVLLDSDVSFVESKESFADDLRHISPTVFHAVPLVWFAIQQKILAHIPEAKLNFLLKIPVLNWLIRRKLRNTLGLSRCEMALSGAAPLPDATARFFQHIGITILQGYGQTENLIQVSANPPGAMKIGTVGTPRTDVEVKIDPDNQELLIKSSGNMLGYYRDPEATARCIQLDGFMRSGDMASIDQEGYISLLGRVSEQFKTQKGEFISPTPIELQFTADPDVQFACLMGRELPQPVLLVRLFPEALQQSREAITANLSGFYNKINPRLTKIEKISHVLIVKELWTSENGFLTPTLKMKRHMLEKKYSPLFEKLTHQSHPIVWEDSLI